MIGLISYMITKQVFRLSNAYVVCRPYLVTLCKRIREVLFKMNLFALPPAIRIVAMVPRCSIITIRPLSTATRIPRTRTYSNALSLLDSLQSNRTVVTTISSTSTNMNQYAIPEMIEWAKKAGYDSSDFARHGLRCIHVAGTKGKGSVCAMVENILKQFRGEDRTAQNRRRRHLRKIGMYTSPHLVTVRERIRIDGSPISESQFTHYFFELWDRLCDVGHVPNLGDIHNSSNAKLGYFRFLTLLAFHTFIREGVETAIVECGIGGEYDSTNILPHDAVSVTAVTRLGIDHVGMLGDSIEQIAWHKAGIMKPSVPMFSVLQAPEAQMVLDTRAKEKGVLVEYVPRSSHLEGDSIRLGLEGDFQKDNASLAMTIADRHLRNLEVSDSYSGSSLSNLFNRGLETVQLLGRCQVRKSGNIEWYIDGAHTADSMQATATWFGSKLSDAISSCNPPPITMLIFNQQDRDAEELLRILMNSLILVKPTSRAKIQSNVPTVVDFLGNRVFKFAAFCRNTVYQTDVEASAELGVQEACGRLYQTFDHNSLYLCMGSVEEAVEMARRVSEGELRVLVLVTGSLHLAGGILTLLDKEAQDDKLTGR